MKYLVLLLFLPIFLIADVNEEYSKIFCDHLAKENYDKCEETLDDWQTYYNPGLGQIAALRAFSLLCKGEFEAGRSLLEEALECIPETHLTESKKEEIRKVLQESSSLVWTLKDTSYSEIMPFSRSQKKVDGSRCECMNDCLGPNPSGALQILLCMILCSL